MGEGEFLVDVDGGALRQESTSSPAAMMTPAREAGELALPARVLVPVAAIGARVLSEVASDPAALVAVGPVRPVTHWKHDPQRTSRRTGRVPQARRSELSPRAVGLSDSGRPRRVAGLRREEVAQSATISTDYYTRLEQGRIQASAPVLDLLAQALRLGEDQRAYLFELAGKVPGRAGGPCRRFSRGCVACSMVSVRRRPSSWAAWKPRGIPTTRA